MTLRIPAALCVLCLIAVLAAGCRKAPAPQPLDAKDNLGPPASLLHAGGGRS